MYSFDLPFLYYYTPCQSGWIYCYEMKQPVEIVIFYKLKEHNLYKTSRGVVEEKNVFQTKDEVELQRTLFIV